MKLGVIFDIDGTICDNNHRKYLAAKQDWENFHSLCMMDTPIIPVIDILSDLCKVGYHIFYSTARPEYSRLKTEDWLSKYVNFTSKNNIFMRTNNDNRPSETIKEEHLKSIRNMGYHIMYAFDDHINCIKMYRNNGVYCFNMLEIK